MNSERDKIDDFLDGAFKSYSQVEPRAGFESRILANLRNAQVRPWWRVRMVYVCAATVLLGAVLYGVWQVATVNSGLTKNGPPMVARALPSPEVEKTNLHTESVASTHQHSIKQARTQWTQTAPQHEAFGSQLPAPRPLSNQEKLLLAFARENPSEIVSTIAWQEEMRRPPEPAPVEDRGEQQ